VGIKVQELISINRNLLQEDFQIINSKLN